jgi:farnesyl-diphosphate farnesyltransferase
MKTEKNDPQQLGGALLASVSRSFYLSIKVLPKTLREPLGLAYLLARATDTIADTAAAPSEKRRTHLRALAQMIRTGSDREKIALLQKEILPDDKAERELLTKIEPCLAWLAAQSADDRADIVNVLEKIICGQELDILRFANPNTAVALQSAGELDEYTYLVAGCVGEFWTRLYFRHLPGASKLDGEAMCELGVNFGKGLQLVNILRDLPADLRAGRCYLPASELKAAGANPSRVRESAELVRPVFDAWLKKAAAHLDGAFHYIESLRNRRVRLACILPWFIGVRTLALLMQKYPLTTDERVKVSRREVRTLLLFAPLAAMSNTVLRLVHARLKRALSS